MLTRDPGESNQRTSTPRLTTTRPFVRWSATAVAFQTANESTRLPPAAPLWCFVNPGIWGRLPLAEIGSLTPLGKGVCPEPGNALGGGFRQVRVLQREIPPRWHRESGTQSRILAVAEH